MQLNIRYKYKLSHLLSLLPPGIYPENVYAFLEVTYQVPSDVFYKDRHILIDDEDEIPYERLLIYAELFDVEVQDLKSVKTISNDIMEKLT